MQKLTDLLNQTDLTRQKFAQILGVSERTTYWDEAPQYAVAYLKLCIKNQRTERLRQAVRECFE